MIETEHKEVVEVNEKEYNKLLRENSRNGLPKNIQHLESMINKNIILKF